MNSSEDKREELRIKLNKWLTGCAIPAPLVTDRILDLFGEAYYAIDDFLMGRQNANVHLGPAKIVNFLTYLLSYLPKDLPQRVEWSKRRAEWVDNTKRALAESKSYSHKQATLITVEHRSVAASETPKAKPNVVQLSPFECLCDAPTPMDGLGDELRKSGDGEIDSEEPGPLG